MTRRIHTLLKNLISNHGRVFALSFLAFLPSCKHKSAEPSALLMAPYVIKKVVSAPIRLPTMIVRSNYGSREVHPSIWNQKTLKFSNGMPQKIIVKKGESLFSLSKKYAVPIPLIIQKNNLKPPFSISPGQVLILMGPKIHIVQKNQNLYEISILHNVSLSALTRQNKIPAPYKVKAGQKLILPAERAPIKASSEGFQEKPSMKFKEDVKKPQRRYRKLSQKDLEKVPSRMGRKFLRPIKGKLISGFGPKGKGLYNDGVNILAPRGTLVRSAESGLVVYRGSDIKSYGNLVLVKHEGGWMSAYAHLEKVSVKKGQIVKGRTVIGHVGTSGFIKQPQLHFELRKNGKPVNPILQFR
jgi:murein DD-endopeptidase MepM/ murein hydrolase activator NlpD